MIWERDVGQLQRLLATPIPRLAIVLGKASGAGIRALTQAAVLLVVLAIAGIWIRWNVLDLAGALVLLVLANRRRLRACRCRSLRSCERASASWASGRW